MTFISERNIEVASFSGARLRELREQKGLDITFLARRLAFSVAQLEQLEKNESSLFYSEAIRVSAARKVAEFLGEPFVSQPPQVPGPDTSLNAPVDPKVPQDLAFLGLTFPKRRDGQLQPTRYSFLVSGWGMAFIAVISIFLIVLVTPNKAPVPSLAIAQRVPAPVTLATSKPLSGESTQQLTLQVTPPSPQREILTVLPAVNAKETKVSQVASDNPLACNWADGPIDSYVPAKAIKDSGTVYVKGAPGRVVCVKDGRGKEWQHTFSAVGGQSFYGAAPWLVASSQLSDLEVYFQGARVRSQTGAKKLRLLSANPA